MIKPNRIFGRKLLSITVITVISLLVLTQTSMYATYMEKMYQPPGKISINSPCQEINLFQSPQNNNTITTPCNDIVGLRHLKAPRNNFTITRSTSCREVHHVYFLKVHKAGSTSVHNMLSRFAQKRDLNVLTIFHDWRLMSYPKRRFDTLLPAVPPKGLVNGKYDMYVEHSIYDEDYLMTKLHADTVNIAIMREPFSQFLSSFHFYHWQRDLELENDPDPITRFLENPEYYRTHYSDELKWRVPDRVAMVFGYRPQDHDLEEYIHYIDSKFLVLITERLAESLVILKRRMCWDMKDILIPHGRRKEYEKPETNVTLIELHKSWSPVDYAFYDYFTRAMADRIANEDNDFPGEVAVFEDYLAKTREFCDGVCGQLHRPSQLSIQPLNPKDRATITTLLHNSTHFAETKWSSEFHVTGLDCIMMRANPMVFRGMQKVRLFPDYCIPNKQNSAYDFYIDPSYCNDLFDEVIQWQFFEDPSFIEACY